MKRMTTATLGGRFQFVISRAGRQRLKLKPRMQMTATVEGNAMVIRPAAVRELRGVGRALADGTDTTAHIRELRAEWDSRP